MIKAYISGLFSVLLLSLAAVTILIAQGSVNPTPALADHKEIHCNVSFLDAAELATCIENIPTTPAERAVYCINNVGSDTGAEFDACLAGFTPDDPSTFDTPCVDYTTFATDNTIQLDSVDIDTSENPIYLKLIQIVNFASIGVGVVAAISVAIAGIQYMTSRGNSAGTAAAITRLSHAGLAIAMYVFGWALLNWLVPGGVINNSPTGNVVTQVGSTDITQVNFCPQQFVEDEIIHYRSYFGDPSVVSSIPVDSGTPGGFPITVISGNFTINFPRSNVISTYWKPGLSPKQRIFTVFCDYSHTLSDDPIVFPAQPGVSHSHDFLGNDALDANSTTQSLLDNGINSCRVPEDRSAYWIPTVTDNGKVQHPASSKFYYRSGKLDPQSIQPMPVGLRMIAGNAKATTNQSERVGKYFTALLGPLSSPSTQDSIGKPNMITTTAAEQGVRLDVHFPSCWDGVNLWLPDSKHVAYHDNGTNGGRFAKCPATHPVPIIELTFNVHFPKANGGSDFRLSSGGGGAKSWTSFHADFINGWHPGTLEGLTKACIQASRYCQAVDNMSCNVRFGQPLSPVPTNDCIEVHSDGQIIERVRPGGPV